MKVTFDTHGNEKQKQAAIAWGKSDEVDEIIYGGSKNSGKSYLGCNMVFGDALTYDETFHFIARKNLNDIRKHTIPSIHEVFNDWGLRLEDYATFNGQDSVYNFTNGSKVFLLDAKFLPSDPQYHRFGSMQMTRGWIEEGGEFEEDAKNALKISTGRKNNDKYNLPPKLLITCNPSKNFLYQDYKDNKEGVLVKEKKFIQALPEDNKRAPKGYLDMLNRTLKGAERERLLKGNWEYDSNPLAIFKYEKILEMFTNSYIATGEPHQTCDIAYEGSDIFVTGIWDGLRLKKVIPIDKINDVHVPAWVHGHRMEYKVPMGNVIYDADGLQKFTKQSTKTGNLAGGREFHNGGKPFDPAYYNLKAECYFKLAELVSNNEIFIEDLTYKEQIIQELEQIRKIMTDDNKIRLESKKDLRERLKRSPDFADMLMMRMLPLLKPVHQTTFLSYK